MPALAFQSFSCIRHCRSFVKENLCALRHSKVKLAPGILPQKHTMHFMSLFPMDTPEIDPYSITQRGARITTSKGHDETVQLWTRHICCIVLHRSVLEDMAMCWQIVCLKKIGARGLGACLVAVLFPALSHEGLVALRQVVWDLRPPAQLQHLCSSQ